MKTSIPFLNAGTLEPSDSADHIEIIASSRSLDWDGVYIERGSSSLFVPENVVVPKHYFAMLLSDQYTWEWKDKGKFRKHTTYPGQIWVNPAGRPFTHRINSYNEFILLTIDPSKILESIHDVALKTRDRFVCCYNEDDARLKSLMYALMAEAQAGGTNGNLFWESLTTALAIHFAKHYSLETGPIPEYRAGLSREQMNRVMEYIDVHLMENISLEDLAKEVHMSKFNFCRLFRQSANITPYQYFLRRRTEKARQILEKGNMSIGEITYMFGFSDQSHFTRLFKARYGITPKLLMKKG